MNLKYLFLERFQHARQAHTATDNIPWERNMSQKMPIIINAVTPPILRRFLNAVHDVSPNMNEREQTEKTQGRKPVSDTSEG